MKASLFLVLFGFGSLVHCTEFPVLNYVPDLIRYWGYPFEDHYVTTDDGYILNLHRIPQPGGKAVFLQHGLFGSAARFTTGPPHASLAYILSDLGYDVWLGNTRGNLYSRNHTSLNPDTDLDTFWVYDWDVAGVHDLPACFDYVLSNTGETDLQYVCHSQGCSEFLSLMSQFPDQQTKVSTAFMMAPPSYFSDVSLILGMLASHVFELEDYFEAQGIWEVLVDNPQTSVIGHEQCDEAHFAENEEYCMEKADQLVGCSPDQYNTSMLPILFDVWPEGTSIKPVVHYGQLINTPDFFGKYDWGSEGDNLAHYGTPTPPAYNLSAITLPVHIFYGNDDALVAVVDVLRLVDELPNVQLAYEVPYDGWAHNDMIYGVDAPELVYSVMTDLMSNF